ncbi:MAG: hypothetical protein FWC06_08690 [Treponema sp.]|nr:hypothetical protein [Treponema sp.]
MKAYFEMDTPESCSECCLSRGARSSVGSICYCSILKEPGYTDQRHPKCPLKIVQSCKDAPREDGKCIGYAKENDDEPADECMNCKENIFYEEEYQ